VEKLLDLAERAGLPTPQLLVAWRSDGTLVQPRCARAVVLSLLIASSLMGCAPGSMFLSKSTVGGHTPERTLKVVHVVSEMHLLAGFPRTREEYITAANEIQPLLVGVVDGFPMVAKGVPRDESGSVPAPWAILTGRGYATTPNIIDPGQSVAPGDTVLVGGFARPSEGMTAIEYLDVGPSVISGRVLESHIDNADTPARYFVSAPDGEYGGFIGGPAALFNADGNLRVWGVIVRWERFALGSLPACRLEVARLGADAGQGSSSTSEH